MKVIETKGITYLEKFYGCEEWYWGTDYSCGDLYEAEEVFRSGKKFKPNRLIFVHYPDGTVFEPMKAKEHQYFGIPAYIDGVIYFLLVDFAENVIRIFQYSDEVSSHAVDLDESYVAQSMTNSSEVFHKMKTIVLTTEIPLSNVTDCYNLKIDGSPVMLTRQGGDHHFQIVWPEQVDFLMGRRESFLFREGEKLFFSEWHEDPDYWEEINVREYPTGNLLEKIEGSVMTMPDRPNWILR